MPGSYLQIVITHNLRVASWPRVLVAKSGNILLRNNHLANKRFNKITLIIKTSIDQTHPLRQPRHISRTQTYQKVTAIPNRIKPKTLSWFDTIA